jgi:hypothetical protein
MVRFVSTFIAVYGSAAGIGFFTDWRVGVLLIVFAVGHNIDKHWGKDHDTCEKRLH